ncbi:hypothetical protein C8Q79DRAFT_137705 [Trametes meyenii]|nr:hypothetical protein C8Q79DRAFT_137705 [Trametes meyenii]
MRRSEGGPLTNSSRIDHLIAPSVLSVLRRRRGKPGRRLRCLAGSQCAHHRYLNVVLMARARGDTAHDPRVRTAVGTMTRDVWDVWVHRGPKFRLLTFSPRRVGHEPRDRRSQDTPRRPQPYPRSAAFMMQRPETSINRAQFGVNVPLGLWELHRQWVVHTKAHVSANITTAFNTTTAHKPRHYTRFPEVPIQDCSTPKRSFNANPSLPQVYPDESMR